MDTIFDEWDDYSKRKTLLPRAIDLSRLSGDARIKIVALTGIRRCGKTSVLLLLAESLRKQGKKTGFVNLEDSRLQNEKALESLLKWFGDEGYLLIDEVTSAPDWQGWLARNHEMLKGKLCLIVSSSRSSLSVPNKPLRGRILPFEMYPLSFSEFLSFKKETFKKTTAGIGRIERLLSEYLTYGGFPECVLISDTTEKIRVLNSYFRDIIGLDVAEIAKENISTVELFGKYVIESPYFSASKCLNSFKSMGHKISKTSLLRLERCSQEGYLSFFVPIFSFNMKDRSQYPRKAYMGDTGFAYSIRGKADHGRSYENAVFLQLKRTIGPNDEINYWKNKEGLEADLIVRKGTLVKKIYQVTYSLDDEKTKDRELKGLIACAKEFKKKEGTLITKDMDKSELIEGVKVRYIPLWRWLLETDG